MGRNALVLLVIVGKFDKKYPLVTQKKRRLTNDKTHTQQQIDDYWMSCRKKNQLWDPKNFLSFSSLWIFEDSHENMSYYLKIAFQTQIRQEKNYNNIIFQHLGVQK